MEQLVLQYRETLSRIDVTGPVIPQYFTTLRLFNLSTVTNFQIHIIPKAPKRPVPQEHGEEPF